MGFPAESMRELLLEPPGQRRVGLPYSGYDAFHYWPSRFFLTCDEDLDEEEMPVVATKVVALLTYDSPTFRNIRYS
jgi:hypothetical protein